MGKETFKLHENEFEQKLKNIISGSFYVGNIQNNFPDGLYRKIHNKKEEKLYSEHFELWKAIDEYIANNNFDLNSYRKALEELEKRPEDRNKELTDSMSRVTRDMYIHLRKLGFDKDLIIR